MVGGEEVGREGARETRGTEEGPRGRMKKSGVGGGDKGNRREGGCELQRQDGEEGAWWMGRLGAELLPGFLTSPLATFCSSLQLNSLGPEACRDLRDLLLHDKCQITTLR